MDVRLSATRRNAPSKSSQGGTTGLRRAPAGLRPPRPPFVLLLAIAFKPYCAFAAVRLDHPCRRLVTRSRARLSRLSFLLFDLAHRLLCTFPQGSERFRTRLANRLVRQ
jgi:hypothetical protein